MEIGIVGLGIVGSACRAGFEHCGFNVTVHDTKLDTKINDVIDTEIVFICVPTPGKADGSCDTGIVEQVIHDLKRLDYQGIIAIKSTVEPGFTKRMISMYDDRILFVPEFLKERSAEYDFIFDQKLLLVGTDNAVHYYTVVRSHGALPKSTKRISPTEAELVKYYHNVFNATRVVFANIFYELSERLGADYSHVKDAFLVNSKLPDEYLDVQEDLRGYGGACLPKDVNAIQQLCDTLDLPYEFFKQLDIENKKFKRTVFKGMRD